MITSAVRIVIASIAMGAVAFVVERWTATWMPQSALPWQLLRLCITIAVALATLAAGAWVLQIEEFNDSMRLILRRFRRRSA